LVRRPVKKALDPLPAANSNTVTKSDNVTKEWFSIWLSADEIKETLTDFGMAWSLDQYCRAEKPDEEWGCSLDCYMSDVEAGRDIMGNRGDRIGDEDRYRREREERERQRAEFDAKWEAWRAEAEAELKVEGHDEHGVKLRLFGRLVGQLAKGTAA
jgi:hypothetical protein